MFKKTRYFSTLLKAKKKDHFKGLLPGPSLLQHKNGQLGPDNNPSKICAHFFSKKEVLKPPPPIFIVLFDKQYLKKQTWPR